MIRVDEITVHEFRGIRDLTLDLKGENFAVCGPNGTGKSGIVDALEFALTGSLLQLQRSKERALWTASIASIAPWLSLGVRNAAPAEVYPLTAVDAQSALGRAMSVRCTAAIGKNN